MICPNFLVPYLELLTPKPVAILTRPFGYAQAWKTNICSPKISDLQPNLHQIPQPLVGTTQVVTQTGSTAARTLPMLFPLADEIENLYRFSGED